MRSLALNGLCVLLSLAAVVAVCEAGLRTFYPRYHHAAQAHREPDSQRIWKPPANSHYKREHPDTGELHRVLHNNLGGRQHRNFDQQSLDGAVNLAFFGDSQTANLRMPVQYSFHEVLDFLLNAAPMALDPSRRQVPAASQSAHPTSARHRFNVLSFGVDAYGPGQSFNLWRDLPVRSAVDHVIYMFNWNDLEDLHRRRLYVLGEHGGLEEHLPAPTPLWTSLLARLHLTYLVLDGSERLRREWRERFPMLGGGRRPDGVADSRPAPDLRLWRAVVLRWQQEVEEFGSTFTVVGLPYDLSHAALAALPDSVETFSLLDCFRDEWADPLPGHMLGFKNDGHWNEAANMVAAHCLYGFLEERLGLASMRDAALARNRYLYYRSFFEGTWEGQRWMPEPPWVVAGAFSARDGLAIVEKYLALERSRTQLDEYWRRVVRVAKAEGPLARGAWDVYPVWDKRLLVYVKKPCEVADLTRTQFFLHVYPANLDRGWRGSFPGWPSPAENEFLDLRDFFIIWQRSDECAIGFHLPKVPISHARTGQFVRNPAAPEDRTLLWSVELPLRKYAD